MTAPGSQNSETETPPKGVLSAPATRRPDIVVPAAFLALCFWGFLIWPPSSDPFPYFLAIPLTVVGLFYFSRALWLRLGRRGRRHLILGLAGVAGLIVFVLAGMQIWASSIVTRHTPDIEARLSNPGGAPISMAMQDATVAMEDENFYEHHGLDWTALHRALRVNLRAGRI